MQNFTGFVVYNENNQESLNISIPETFIQDINVKNANFYDENNNGLVDKIELKNSNKLTSININSEDQERVIVSYTNGNSEVQEINKRELDSLINNVEINTISPDSKFKIDLTQSVPIIKANILHNLNITGDSAVCILDTGIYSEHPNFAGRIVNEYCFSDNDYLNDGIGHCYNNTEEYPDANDDLGHGTLVAGIVGSSVNLNGVAINSKIVAVKICSYAGECYYSDLIKGINYCIDNKDKYNISVITLSLGSSYTYDNYASCDLDNIEITNAMNRAYAEGIFIDVSSGNSYSRTGISTPACLANVTSVGATTKSDTIASYSNIAPLLSVLAPGSSIYSTVCVSGGSMCSSSGYASASGTSFASPHVAGSAVLLKQYVKEKYNSSLNPDLIRESLKNSGVVINFNGANYSRIDLVNATAYLDTIFMNLNETLDSWTDLEKEKPFYYYKSYLENITFYANLTKGYQPITNGTCNLSLENETFLMNFNSNKNIFEYSKNISEFKDYNYSIICNNLTISGIILQNNFNFYLNHSLQIYVRNLENENLSNMQLVIYEFNNTNYSYNETISNGISNILNITEFLFVNSSFLNKTPHKILVYYGNESLEKELTINYSILTETSDNLFLLNISNNTQPVIVPSTPPSSSGSSGGSGGSGGGSSSSTKKSTQQTEQAPIVQPQEPQKFELHESEEDETRTLETTIETPVVEKGFKLEIKTIQYVIFFTLILLTLIFTFISHKKQKRFIKE